MELLGGSPRNVHAMPIASGSEAIGLDERHIAMGTAPRRTNIGKEIRQTPQVHSLIAAARTEQRALPRGVKHNRFAADGASPSRIHVAGSFVLSIRTVGCLAAEDATEVEGVIVQPARWRDRRGGGRGGLARTWSAARSGRRKNSGTARRTPNKRAT